MTKVFLVGRDSVGWSIDYDRKYTEMFLRDIGHTLTSNFLTADVIHAVWWNPLLSIRFFPLRWKRIISVATYEVDIGGLEFKKAKKFVNLWIAPSKAMYDKLKLAGVDVKYQPFYVDERIFTRLSKDKREIAEELGIDYKSLQNKLVIGSFQRDSLGIDLSKPKWQKGPELLVDILSKLPKNKFVLLLAGPRRHWIINECRRLDIPYLYYGEEPRRFDDDIEQNTSDKRTMNKLYNLADLYIVSSRSEGGPKAVLESAFTKIMILSTDVGLAPDFLDPWCIYKSAEEAVHKVEEIIRGKDVTKIIELNYRRANRIASYKPMMDRWGKIYEYFQNKYL